MLRYKSEVFRRARIRRSEGRLLKESLAVVDVRNMKREHRLRWFGHLMRRGEKDLVRAIKRHRVEGRPRSRLRGWIWLLEGNTKLR